MKNNLLWVFILLTTYVCSGTAQKYALGEHILIDDIPSIVIYVDSTGEHGLVMSATACYDKHVVEQLFGTDEWKYFTDDITTSAIQISRPSPGFEEAYLAMPTFDYKKYEYSKEKRQKQLALLRNKTSAYGKENTKIIANFCEENNLDMQEYFPEQVWASELGEGWYIPGNAELELYAKCIEIPVSKSNTQPARGKVYWRFTFAEYLNYDISGMCDMKSASATLFAPINVRSSTLMISDWSTQMGNADKILKYEYQQVQKAIAHKRITDYDNYYVLSAFRRGRYPDFSVYMSFYVSGQDSGDYKFRKEQFPYVVAVKEF